MTCGPYCDICGGNLGHPANGDSICNKCSSINEALAPVHDRFCRCRTCKPSLGPSDQFIRRGHSPDVMPPLRFERYRHIGGQTMPEPVKIAIVIEGGCLQSVLTAGVPVEYVLVDYDTDGTDETQHMPQDDGTLAPAFISTESAQPAGPFVMRAFDAAI